jgi:peptidoglycan/xylan/chitin deacetylase (PgdA/CDA1 family)
MVCPVKRAGLPLLLVALAVILAVISAGNSGSARHRVVVAAGIDVDGALLVTVSALARLHVPVLVGCVPAGPSLVYDGSPSLHEIALTFDDGPWSTPPTIDFVNRLAHYHVPGTFFEIGRQIPEFDPTGAVERAMLANGDMIGDHTW